MHLITAALARTPGRDPPEVPLRVERIVLAKRIWRGTADDGAEFGFDLAAPLKHGDVFYESGAACYVVRQAEEALIEISLDIPPAMAAGIGWAVGNLHLELSSEPTRLLTPDAPAARQLLARIGVSFRPTSGVFRPGRFSRGEEPARELGASHRH